jgi:hypothetical protein
MSGLERGGDRRPRPRSAASVPGGLANAGLVRQRSKTASGPPVRHYDRSGVFAPGDGEHELSV